MLIIGDAFAEVRASCILVRSRGVQGGIAMAIIVREADPDPRLLFVGEQLACPNCRCIFEIEHNEVAGILDDPD
jgi:hypothetical protein